MVSATDVFTAVTHSTPRRLHRAASPTAGRKGRAPVTTAAAMALGASVQPLTSRTARVSSTVRVRAGLAVIWHRNSGRDRGMGSPPPPLYGGGGGGMSREAVTSGRRRPAAGSPHGCGPPGGCRSGRWWRGCCVPWLCRCRTEGRLGQRRWWRRCGAVHGG